MLRLYLGVLELLFYLIDETTTNFANKTSVQQLRPDFTCSRHCATDTHQRTDFICAEIPDARDQRKVIECNVEFAGLEVRRVRGGGSWIYLEILGLILCDQVVKRATQVWEESVVLLLDCVRKDVVSLQKMTVIHVERRDFIFPHGVDLLDIHQLSIRHFG